jgi:hypothetical protein
MELEFHENSESLICPEIRGKGFLMLTHLLLRNVWISPKYRRYDTGDRTLQNSLCPIPDLSRWCVSHTKESVGDGFSGNSLSRTPFSPPSLFTDYPFCLNLEFTLEQSFRAEVH